MLGIPGTFSSPPSPKETASQRSRHASRHVRHAHAVMQVGIVNSQGRGKGSRHSRRMRNPQFYVPGNRPIEAHSTLLAPCEGVPLLPEYSPHKVPIMRSFDVSSVVSFGKLWTNRLRLYMFTQFMIAKLNGQSAGKCICIIFRMTNTGCQVWVWNSQTSHWGYNSTRQQLIDQRVYVWCYLWNISENIWRLPQNMPLGKITWV